MRQVSTMVINAAAPQPPLPNKHTHSSLKAETSRKVGRRGSEGRLGWSCALCGIPKQPGVASTPMPVSAILSTFSVAERDRGWDMSEWYLVVSKAHTHDGEDVPKELEIRMCRRPQGPSGGS